MHPLRMLREKGAASQADYVELLSENVVFHSPMFVKAVVGREFVAAIFAGSASLREGHYTHEVKFDDRTTFLRWQGTIGGHEIESLEVIVDDEEGLIAERTVAFRPYPALKIFRDQSLASPLAKDFPKEYLDYPENLEKEDS